MLVPWFYRYTTGNNSIMQLTMEMDNKRVMHLTMEQQNLSGTQKWKWPCQFADLSSGNVLMESGITRQTHRSVGSVGFPPIHG